MIIRKLVTVIIPACKQLINAFELFDFARWLVLVQIDQEFYIGLAPIIRWNRLERSQSVRKFQTCERDRL